MAESAAPGVPATNVKLLLHPTDLTQGSEKAFAVAVVSPKNMVPS